MGLSFEQTVLLFAAAAAYTKVVTITMFILFKIGDPSNVSQLAQLDGAAKSMADVSKKIAGAVATAAAIYATGAMGAGSRAVGEAGKVNKAAKAKEQAELDQAIGAAKGEDGTIPPELKEQFDKKQDDIDAMPDGATTDDYLNAAKVGTASGAWQATQAIGGVIASQMPGGGRGLKEVTNAWSEGSAQGARMAKTGVTGYVKDEFSAAQAQYDSSELGRMTSAHAAQDSLYNDKFRNAEDDAQRQAAQVRGRAKHLLGEVDQDDALSDMGSIYEGQALDAARNQTTSAITGNMHARGVSFNAGLENAASSMKGAIAEENKKVDGRAELKGKFDERAALEGEVPELEAKLKALDPSDASFSAIESEWEAKQGRLSQLQGELGDIKSASDINDLVANATVNAGIASKLAAAREGGNVDLGENLTVAQDGAATKIGGIKAKAEALRTEGPATIDQYQEQARVGAIQGIASIKQDAIEFSKVKASDIQKNAESEAVLKAQSITGKAQGYTEYKAKHGGDMDTIRMEAKNAALQGSRGQYAGTMKAASEAVAGGPAAFSNMARIAKAEGVLAAGTTTGKAMNYEQLEDDFKELQAAKIKMDSAPAGTAKMAAAKTFGDLRRKLGGAESLQQMAVQAGLYAGASSIQGVKTASSRMSFGESASAVQALMDNNAAKASVVSKITSDKVYSKVIADDIASDKGRASLKQNIQRISDDKGLRAEVEQNVDARISSGKLSSKISAREAEIAQTLSEGGTVSKENRQEARKIAHQEVRDLEINNSIRRKAQNQTNTELTEAVVRDVVMSETHNLRTTGDMNAAKFSKDFYSTTEGKQAMASAQADVMRRVQTGGSVAKGAEAGFIDFHSTDINDKLNIDIPHTEKSAAMRTDYNSLTLGKIKDAVDWDHSASEKSKWISAAHVGRSATNVNWSHKTKLAAMGQVDGFAATEATGRSDNIVTANRMNQLYGATEKRYDNVATSQEREVLLKRPSHMRDMAATRAAKWQEDQTSMMVKANQGGSVNRSVSRDYGQGLQSYDGIRDESASKMKIYYKNQIQASRDAGKTTFQDNLTGVSVDINPNMSNNEMLQQAKRLGEMSIGALSSKMQQKFGSPLLKADLAYNKNKDGKIDAEFEFGATKAQLKKLGMNDDMLGVFNIGGDGKVKVHSHTLTDAEETHFMAKNSKALNKEPGKSSSKKVDTSNYQVKPRETVSPGGIILAPDKNRGGNA